MAAFVWRAIQGQAETFTATLSGGAFTGSEVLAATVSTGTADAALLSLTPTWNRPAVPSIDVALSAANLTSLAAGAYIVQIGISGGTAALAFGVLKVQPAPGSALIVRTLATPGDAMLLCPEIASTQDQLDGLPFALEAATRAIETYCRRVLALTSFDRLYRPGRTRKIYLHSWPIAPGLRLKCDLSAAFTIQNTSTATNTVGYVSMTPTNYYSWTPATLTLTWYTSAGAQQTSAFTLANYATIGALVTAISAVGSGWTATAVGNSYNAVNLANWPTSELLYDPGTHGALNQQYELQVYTRDIVRYITDFNRGVVELTENRPDAYRYADRAYGIGFGWSWSAAAEPRHANVRAVYKAGYAVAAADVTAGYEPAPEDLRAACVMTAKAILAAAPLVGPVKTQSVKDRSYSLADEPSVIPAAARVILDNSKYMNTRLALGI